MIFKNERSIIKDKLFTHVSDLDNGIQELGFVFIDPWPDVTGQQVVKGSGSINVS